MLQMVNQKGFNCITYYRDCSEKITGGGGVFDSWGNQNYTKILGGVVRFVQKCHVN